MAVLCGVDSNPVPRCNALLVAPVQRYIDPNRRDVQPAQLESIGLCNIFKDMLDSGVIPVYRLTQIHRQAAKSAIITESMKVRQGIQLFNSGWVGMETRGEQQDLDLKVYSD